MSIINGEIGLWNRWCSMLDMLRPSLSGILVGLVSAAIFFLAGCRPVSQSGTTVRGIVKFQGQPVAGGLVVFSPDSERGGSGKPIPGEIAQDGSFRLSIGGNPTIPPGWYRVAIAPVPLGNFNSPLDGPIFPTQLARPDQSGLIRQVQSGQDNAFEFVIETK